MRALILLAGWVLSACASAPAPPVRATVILLGEQHDAARHRDIQRDWIDRLAGRGQLSALALEMAEQGRSTDALGAAASETTVREALAWSDAAWPWVTYGPVVMAAVRAGIAVHGANLARASQRGAMQDATLDGLLPPAALAEQERAIRDGHCGLMPEHQLRPMARVQVARDRAMAQTLTALARPGRTVLLIAGSHHVEPRLGVPQHLPRGLAPQVVVLPPEPAAQDHCEALRRQLKPPA